MKFDKETGVGCLVWIGIIVLIIFSIDLCSNNDTKKDYLVEETGYIHSTDNENKCHYIDAAKKDGYKITQIERSEAIDQRKKMCKACFTKEEMKKYYQTISAKDKYERCLSDLEVWETLKDNENTDELFVYMEQNGKLHIDGNCIFHDGELTRVNFGDINDIYSTCTECVEHEYMDFIYNKINGGGYDISKLKNVERDDYE